MRCRENKIQDFLLALPPILWLLVFYALPVLVVFLLSFKPVDSSGGIGTGWTLKTVQELGNPNYPAIIWRTVWQGVVSTAVCVITAIPVSYYLARISEKSRRGFLMLIIIPFWTNFLIRI